MSKLSHLVNIVTISIILMAVRCSTAYPTTYTLNKFAGRGTYAYWTSTQSAYLYTQPRLAYLSCKAATRPSLLSDIPVSGQLIFAVTIWRYGIRSRTTFTFQYKIWNTSTVANISNTNWYFFSDVRQQSFNVSLNVTHLVLISDSNTIWTFEHCQPTSPLYVIAYSISTGLALAFLMHNRGYNNQALQPVGRTMLACKFVGLWFITLSTVIATLELLYCLVFTIVLLFGGLFVVLFALAVSSVKRKGQKLETNLVVLFCIFAVIEVVLFGHPNYQFATSIFLILLQLWKRHQVSMFKSKKEQRMFVVFYILLWTFNGFWLHGNADNFYKISPTETQLQHKTHFIGLSVLLVHSYLIQCLLIVMPNIQRKVKPRAKDLELGQCEICTDELVRSNIFMGECRHMYHSDCMLTWLRQKGSCPKCRKAINWQDFFKNGR